MQKYIIIIILDKIEAVRTVVVVDVNVNKIEIIMMPIISRLYLNNTDEMILKKARERQK